ncbi:MAG: S1 RNA-binding domain-containing protein [Lachnospiraceae bacterium]|nr:S1 RNA-binding domain-containing protein [Lachnospiraceae bacterium]
MIKIGVKQWLTVVKRTDFGVYLGTEEERILLPIKQVPEDLEIGDPLEVFVYRDSSDRLIATVRTPKIMLGEVANLTVKEVNGIGAFLDWGLEKDLFLPFKEQNRKLKAGDTCMVALYVDKSDRLCATMKIYNHLQIATGYQKDDEFTGIIYEIKPEMGAFVAVDYRYHGMIPMNEFYGNVSVGSLVTGRVLKVRPDGKLDLGIRKKAHEQMDEDVTLVLSLMKERGGSLSFDDRANPELIKTETGLSKNAFKRAVGRLLKEGKIRIEPNSITLL